jgi:uncharacterized protein YajQ (UPF0234 family)
MSKESSFDIVSEFDIQEMINAVDQTKREAENRYDFKGTNPQIDFEEGRTGLVINVDSEYKLTALLDVLESKMVKRGLSLKILDKTTANEDASGGRIRKKVPFVKGLDSDKAKSITKIIRDVYPKAKASIQGETIRVTSASRDELQGIMQLIRSREDVTVPLQFNNYR